MTNKTEKLLLHEIGISRQKNRNRLRELNLEVKLNFEVEFLRLVSVYCLSNGIVTKTAQKIGVRGGE